MIFKTPREKIWLVFCFALLMALSFTLPHAHGEIVQTEQQLVELLHKIEHQRYSWFGFEAKLKLTFKTETGQTANCQGTLTYLRLNEKMKIDCKNDTGISVFAFQIDDVNFELFLPKANKMFRGSIFDLENNDDFHSHIKPYDIYRAIKPLPLDSSELSPGEILNTSVSLYSWKQNKDIYFMHRKLLVDSQSGNVLEESFYTEENQLAKLIKRSNFMRMDISPNNAPIFFAHTLEIDETIGRQTVFEFSEVKFLSSVVDLDWNIETRPDTEIFTFPTIETQIKRYSYFS